MANSRANKFVKFYFFARPKLCRHGNTGDEHTVRSASTDVVAASEAAQRLSKVIGNNPKPFQYNINCKEPNPTVALTIRICELHQLIIESGILFLVQKNGHSQGELYVTVLCPAVHEM